MNLNLREIAVALDGVMTGGQVSAPGPNHSRKDRSLVVTLSPTAPDGFIVHSHCGDDWRACRDHVAARLGIVPDRDRRRRDRDDPIARMAARQARMRAEAEAAAQAATRAKRAAKLWGEARDPRGTLVERYLNSRALELPPEVAGEALRWHPAVPWKCDETGELLRVPAMVAALRDLRDNRLVGLHRTRLSPEGVKLGRKMSGSAAGAAIKLDGDDVVTTGLTVAEGVETGLAARQLGLRPLWAVGSVGAIRALPVLDGIESLTLCAETDATGANAAALRECGARWHCAGRAVDIAEPEGGGDFNDMLMGGACDGKR